ncbi:MAG: hypothetical protein WCH01_09070 [Methylococcaceae bacterium]
MSTIKKVKGSIDIIRIFLISLSFLGSAGCERESNAWERAHTENTIAGYEEYLKSHADAAHASEASVRIKSLQEERDWLRVSHANTIQGYDSYLFAHKDGKHADEVSARLNELKEERDWSLASNADTSEYIKNFIIAYPNSKHSNEIPKILPKILEEEEWNLASHANTSQLLKKFKIDYPSSQHLKEIPKILPKILEEEWNLANQANKSHLESDVKKILDFFPNGEMYWLKKSPGSIIRIQGEGGGGMSITEDTNFNSDTFGSPTKLFCATINNCVIKTDDRKTALFLFGTLKCTVAVIDKIVMTLYLQASNQPTVLAPGYAGSAVVDGIAYELPPGVSEWRVAEKKPKKAKSLGNKPLDNILTVPIKGKKLHK